MPGRVDDSDTIIAKQARYGYLRSILACPICKQPVDVVCAEEVVRCSHCAEEYRVVSNVPIMLEAGRARELEAMLSRDRDSERMQQEFYDSWSRLGRIYRAIQPPQVHLGLDKITKITQLLNGQGEKAWGLEIGSGKKT